MLKLKLCAFLAQASRYLHYKELLKMHSVHSTKTKKEESETKKSKLWPSAFRPQLFVAGALLSGARPGAEKRRCCLSVSAARLLKTSVMFSPRCWTECFSVLNWHFSFLNFVYNFCFVFKQKCLSQGSHCEVKCSTLILIILDKFWR